MLDTSRQTSGRFIKERHGDLCVRVPAGLSELQLISTFCLFALGAGEVLDPFFLEKRFGSCWVPPLSFGSGWTREFYL